jgi:hypothetical protein
MAGASNPQNVQQPAAAQPQQAYQYQPAASPVAGNVSQTSANLFNQAAAGPNINQFMNPYTGMVTGQAMQDLERQRQMATNDIGTSATRAGAFGGSRHGVAEALTNTGFAQQGANMFANLQQQGFNTALNAAQNQQGIQSSLAGQGFNFANTIADRQSREGEAMRALNQALIDAAKGQYGGFTGAPSNALAELLSGITGTKTGQQTTTEKYKPGLLDYIKAAAGVMPKA